MFTRHSRIAVGVLVTLNSVALMAQATPSDTPEREEITQLERITVRGALSELPLGKMPASISILDSEAIYQRQAEHLQHMLNRAPNVNFSMGASRGRFFQIRGVGERSQFVDPIDPSVGFLVDGINYSGMAAGASTFDIDQIEIFKGPNSARFGADGLAGMINLISSEPTSAPALNVEAGIANYSSYNIGLALGTALSDNARVRASAHQVKSDGFINNTFLQRTDTNGHDEFTGRVKLSADISPHLQLTGSYHHIDVDNGYDAFSLNRDRTTLSDEPGFDRQKSDAIALSADYSGLALGQIQLRGTLLSADLGYGYDEDWSYVGIAPYDPLNDPDGFFAEYSSTDHYFRDRQDSTVEIKWFDNTSVMQGWVLGGYLASRDEDLHREFFDWNSWSDAQFSSVVERDNVAIFAQYRMPLSEASWISLSGRVAQQQLNYRDSRNITQQLDETDWGADLSYNVEVNTHSMVYAKLMRSYKMGGVNGESLGKLDDPALAVFRNDLLENATFEGETLLGTEIGVKGSSADSSLTMQFAAFYQWRDDIQYKNWIVQDQSFVGFYNNAADGKNYGLEAELNWYLSDSVMVFANLGWLETEIDGITRQGETAVINNREQAHAPSYQANLGINWAVTDGLTWLVEADGKDAFYYSFAHDQQSDEVWLLHTNLSYQRENWRVSVYARNLFNQTYTTRGFYFGNDPRDGYMPHTYEQFGEPRRVGVSFKYQY